MTSEDGGVQGVRAWARDAVARAESLLLADPAGPPRPQLGDPAVQDRVIMELVDLEGLLGPDEPMRALLVARLGGLLATRYLTRGGAVADRARGLRLLREARAGGAAVDGWEAQRAALSLVMLLSRTPIRQADGAEHSNPELAELAELLAELGAVQCGPGTSVDPARLVQDSVQQAGASAFEALRSGDPSLLVEAIGSLRQAAGDVPAGFDPHQVLGLFSAAFLSSSQSVGGNQQDAEEAERQLDEAVERLGAAGAAAHPQLAVMTKMQALVLRSRRFRHEGNRAGIETCIEELLALRDSLSEHDRAATPHLGPIAAAHLDLAMVTQDPEILRTGLRFYEEAVQAMESIPSLRGMVGIQLTNLASLRARIDGDPEVLRAHFAARPTEPERGLLDDRVESLAIEALARKTQADLTGARADQDRAIEALQGVRRAAGPDGQVFQHAHLLWTLAEAHLVRGDRQLGDLVAGAEIMVESFEALRDEVLLESGAEHRLLTARGAASRTLHGAWWCGDGKAPGRAVTMLELGRSLVLQAAAASAEVPELLEAHGHHELAAAWRQAGATPTGAADRPPIPGLLRRQALNALRDCQPHSEPPTLVELCAGLRPGEADALVYLLPGQQAADGTQLHGMAIVLTPDEQIGALALPHLAHDERAPLEAYLDLSAERSRLRAGGDEAGEAEEAAAAGLEAVEPRWEQALAELCDWAWPAVVGPLAEGIAAYRAQSSAWGPGDRAEPLRLVLIPCGNLGVVPWHAARHRAEDGRYRYACESMVFSYAASGRQFLGAAARERLAVAERPVLVADPRMDLTLAEREVLALRDGCYQQAELYGAYYELDDPPVGPGTPDELLALLPGGGAQRPLSLLHIASHGSAGVRPTVSALGLAVPEEAEAQGGGAEAQGGRAEGQGGGAAAPDPGMLTVTRLLDRPSAAGADGAGPLVVLSACETDLSTRDHDEALTLATAFLARGAKDVVGSRWTTRDGASALMMTVFHHHVAITGLSPADALRAAQLWMLDPCRTAPPSLRGELLRELEQPDLDRLPIWAAFTHQGHPGPATRSEGTV
ncbi:CHAT domain-containing protein [Kitasatospora sp. NPDC008050]|uniref:CHAT domain-containing protein n=1 Tax=Kitasatospora sp. NPDC008050 TaxID=3364021 RepID=UPI0036EA0CC3